MKVDLIRKFKWYIVGFILVAVMLSVSLSFSAWDTLSFKAMMNAKGGDFKEKSDAKYELGTEKDDDKGTIGIADVGDIVTFGNYYQDANTSTKSPIRWIVVDITDRQDREGKQLTLLAEKVMAFGSFWGTVYYNSGNSGVWGATDSAYQTYNQNYMQSTVRAWLNSNTRTDGGTQFSKIYDSSKPQFRGFLQEAFSEDERGYILSKTISDMKGQGQNNESFPSGYGSGSDKVWLPSYSEVYGNSTLGWGSCSDGSPNKQFEYFEKGDKIAKVAKTTAYASTVKSNYTMDTSALAGTQNYQIVPTGSESPVWWWLRSPNPSLWYYSLYVRSSGDYGNNTGTGDSYGGVRPAVCVQL